MDYVQEMLWAAQNGSAEAFNWLYRETYNRNYYIVIKMVKQEQDAMDVLQDTYIKVFQKISSFQYTGEQSFAAWTGKIASNTALDFLRKKNPVLFSDLQTDEENVSLEEEFADESIENQPDLAWDQKETAQIVREMLDCLSEEQRVCIILRYLRQMKISEIAQECGCSENTIKSRLNYAKKRLLGEREMLERKGIRLYNVAPVTLLILLLQEDVKAAAAPAAVDLAFANILNEAFYGSSANTFYNGGSMENTAPSPESNSGYWENGNGNWGNSSGNLGKAAYQAGSAAKVGAGKIAAIVVVSVAVAGAAAAVGAGIGMTYYEKTKEASVQEASAEKEEKDHDRPSDDRESSGTAAKGRQDTETEQDAKAEEEIYYEYLNEVLIPEYGLADLKQEGKRTTMQSGERGEFEEENKWLRAEGILSAYIEDLDQDNQKELFVLYWEKEAANDGDGHAMMGEIYEIEGEKAVCKDKMAIDDTYYWQPSQSIDGNFTAAAMNAGDKKYLLFYNFGVYNWFSGDFDDHKMWSVEYKNDKLNVVQKIEADPYADADFAGIIYNGSTYENGAVQTEQIYSVDDNIYSIEQDDARAKAFVNFFQRKGLDVSEIVEEEGFLDGISKTENAELICTLNSRTGESESDEEYFSMREYLDGIDGTNLRNHIANP